MGEQRMCEIYQTIHFSTSDTKTLDSKRKELSLCLDIITLSHICFIFSGNILAYLLFSLPTLKSSPSFCMGNSLLRAPGNYLRHSFFQFKGRSNLLLIQGVAYSMRKSFNHRLTQLALKADLVFALRSQTCALVQFQTPEVLTVVERLISNN